MRKPTMALIEKSKLPFQLVTCKPLFNQVPEELDKAFEEGTITHDMYIVMLYLHRKADWGWGVARMMSAERIQKEAWGRVGRKEADTRPSVRTVERILLRLRNCGWITLPDTTKRCSYNVGITNYAARIDGPVVQGDDDVAVLLRPTDIKDYDDVAPLVSHKMANKLTKQCPSSVADVSQECPSSDDVVSAIPDYRLQTTDSQTPDSQSRHPAPDKTSNEPYSQSNPVPDVENGSPYAQGWDPEYDDDPPPVPFLDFKIVEGLE